MLGVAPIVAAIVGYSNHPPLQVMYLALGIVIACVAVGWIRESSHRVSRVVSA
jgi:hypothetical protein